MTVLTPARWRVFVACLGTVIAVLYIWALADWPRYSNPGALGATFGSGGGIERAIAQLQPGSPLAAAGASPGDRVRLDHLRDGRRLIGAGERIGLTIVSQGSDRHVEVIAQPAPQSFFTGGVGAVITAAVSAIALAIALVVGLRRADEVSLRFLSLAVLMQPLNYVNLRLPSGATGDFLFVLSPLVPYVVVYFCFLAFCLTFPDGQAGPTRSRMRRFLVVPSAVLAFVTGAWGVTEYARGMPWSLAAYTAPFAIAYVAASLGALAVAWRESSGTLRLRIGWIAASMGLVYLSYLWSNAMALLGLNDWVKSHQYMPAGMIALGYCGLAYALLRHRIFDIGFVVNRALVYGAVSITILLAFGLLEWLAHKLVHFEDQQKNTILDAGIALAVFLAFNTIHHRAEHWVERLFFRGWHRREEAMRLFVKEAAHVKSPAALLDAFHSALERFSGGARCAILLRDAEGTYRSHAPGDDTIGEDDPIALALRTTPAPTLLEGGRARDGMELALPMSHRGQLEGIVLIARRPGGEPYRPDEIELLRFAAHQVGLDLHAREVERLQRELEAAGVEIARANARAEAFRSLVVNGGASAE